MNLTDQELVDKTASVLFRLIAKSTEQAVNRALSQESIESLIQNAMSDYQFSEQQILELIQEAVSGVNP